MTKRNLTIFIILMSAHILWTCSDPAEDDVTAPDAPTALSYDINQSGDGEIYLTWVAPEDNDVESFNLYRDADGSGNFTVVTTTAQTYYLDSSLDYDITYSYKVTATDDSGNESAFSNSVSLAPANRFSPATPTGLAIKAHNITAEFRTDVELTWEANSENDFADYLIYRGVNQPFFNIDDESLIAEVTDVYYYDTDVTADNTYYYVLKARDKGDKTSDPTQVVFDTPLLEPTLIAPISNNVAASTSPTFRWVNVNKAVKYKIILRTSALTGDIWEFELPAGSATEMTKTYPATLNPNQQYFWFVSAYSQAEGEINSYTSPNAFRTP